MIPEAAVEAAAPWIENFLERRGISLRGKEAQSLAGYVLEAATPHMLADAWELGMTAAKLQAVGIKPARNPYC